VGDRSRPIVHCFKMKTPSPRVGVVQHVVTTILTARGYNSCGNLTKLLLVIIYIYICFFKGDYICLPVSAVRKQSYKLKKEHCMHACPTAAT